MSVALPAPESASRVRNQNQSGDCYDVPTESAKVVSSSLSVDVSCDMISMRFCCVICCRCVSDCLSFVVVAWWSSLKLKNAVSSV